MRRYFFFIAGLIFPASNLLAQAISFLPPIRVSTVGGIRYPFPPNSLAVGDLNRDGKVDLVAVDPPEPGFGQTPLTVSLGNGDGTFRQGQLLTTTDSVSSPVVADFNGDGFLDIAAIETSNGFAGSPLPPGFSLAIYLGNGDGSFRAALITPSSSNTLVEADLNRDGRPDLIAGRTILLGNGDGTFSMLSTSLDASASLSADFNHDGKPDALLVLASKQLAVALGNGDGTFGKDLVITSPFTPGSFAVGNFNGDGSTDLAISPTPTEVCVLVNCSIPIVNIAVLKGNGDGTFQSPVMSGNAMALFWLQAI